MSLKTFTSVWPKPTFSFKIFYLLLCGIALFGSILLPLSYAQSNDSNSNKKEIASSTIQTELAENDFGASSMFSRAWNGGIIVFSVLMGLIFMSILTWGVVSTKLVFLNKCYKANQEFVKSFWESKSLSELNSKLNTFSYSPARELFKMGYSELLKSNQLKENSSNPAAALNAAFENLNRTLGKARLQERSALEKYLGILAISASACPFIGLFGTVWGIMKAFEGIAQSGSASLAAVAPGISEALIATAFGLAAAIPAVIGYNLSANKIRSILVSLDSFSADFMNIVGRYLVSDKSKSSAGGGNTNANVPMSDQQKLS